MGGGWIVIGSMNPLLETHAMFTNLAAGTLIVLGAVIAVLGFILAGSLPSVMVGLGAIAVAGLVSALDRRPVR